MKFVITLLLLFIVPQAGAQPLSPVVAGIMRSGFSAEKAANSLANGTTRESAALFLGHEMTGQASGQTPDDGWIQWQMLNLPASPGPGALLRVYTPTGELVFLSRLPLAGKDSLTHVLGAGLYLAEVTDNNQTLVRTLIVPRLGDAGVK